MPMIQHGYCMYCMQALSPGDRVCPRCGRDSRRAENLPHQLPCGTILAGKLLLGRVLGQGGFGITYVGMDLNLELKVAVKEYYPEGCVSRDSTRGQTIFAHTGDGGAIFVSGRERFVNEAKILARFNQVSGVVNVRDFFKENGTAYIVMDFVDGETLGSFAASRGGRLPWAETMELLKPVFYALTKIHDAGLLHRDISPDNLMLRPDGTVVLLDFGAAREISVDGARSNTVNVKHGYAPEEQYRARGSQGPWTDVYALAATVYRLVTGITPPSALDRLADGEHLPRPNALGAGLTPQREEALMNALAVRSSQRTRSVEELYRGLYGLEGPSAKDDPANVPEIGGRAAAPGGKAPGLKKRARFTGKSPAREGRVISAAGTPAQKPGSGKGLAKAGAAVFWLLAALLAAWDVYSYIQQPKWSFSLHTGWHFMSAGLTGLLLWGASRLWKGARGNVLRAGVQGGPAAWTAALMGGGLALARAVLAVLILVQNMGGSDQIDGIIHMALCLVVLALALLTGLEGSGRPHPAVSGGAAPGPGALRAGAAALWLVCALLCAIAIDAILPGSGIYRLGAWRMYSVNIGHSYIMMAMELAAVWGASRLWKKAFHQAPICRGGFAGGLVRQLSLALGCVFSIPGLAFSVIALSQARYGDRMDAGYLLCYSLICLGAGVLSGLNRRAKPGTEKA